MTDYLLPFTFIGLIMIIIIQGVERYFFAEQAQKEKDKLLEELSRTVKAVIAKNAEDYVMTTSIDKVPTDKKEEPINTDFVPEDSLSDEEFMEAIGNGKKK